MKIQHIVLGFFLSIGSIMSFSLAQNLGSLIDNLGSEIAFGYSNDNNIEITELTGNKVTIQSPLLKDQAGTTITSYTVMYSQHTLSEILNKTTLLNDAKEVPFNISSTADPFTMDVTIDNPNTTAKYYFFVIPKDSKQALGELSNEVWVNFANQSFGADGDGLTQDTHSAATADMSLMHISHRLNQSEITLTWSDINISKTVEIDVMKPGSSLFEDKVTVNMSDEQYVYNASKSGSYTFRFHAIDCGKQINYTVSNVQASATTPTPTPTTGKVTKVPKTGTSENILLILLVAGALYLGYNKFFKKTK